MDSIEIPLFLYKYREDNDYTARIFTDQQVWLSSSEELNDPFECEFEESSAAWTDEAQASHVKEDKIAWDLLKKISDGKQINEVVQDVKSPASLLKKVGIFSLSEDVTNPTMWAHYGANGKGLAIGFMTLPGSKLCSWPNVLKVEYRDGPIGTINEEFVTTIRSNLENGVATIKAELNFEDITVRRVIATKSTQWSYEKEWRYIEHEKGCYEWIGPLMHIVFGWAAPKTTINKFIQLAKTYIEWPCKFFLIIKDSNNKKLMLRPIDQQQRMISPNFYKNATDYEKYFYSELSESSK